MANKLNIGQTIKNGKIVIAPPSTPYDASLANAKSSLYTPAQLRTIANQQTQAQINAQLGASNASSTAEQKQYLDLANRAAGLASALGNYGPDAGAADFDAYNKAAQTIGQLGTGLTGAVAGDWQNEQAASRATVNSALGAGVGQVDSYDPNALRSALQYTGVTMPGSGLAQQALSARAMAIYGNQADKASVASVSQDYITQAREALDKRAAERATIVAQRPELYQSALEAQRQDNAQTQSQINTLVNASANWLQNQQKLAQTQQQLAQSKAQTTKQNRIQEIATTHIDPKTGQPVGGWVWADGTHTAVVPWTSKIAAQQTNKRIAQAGRSLTIQEQHYKDMRDNYDRTYNLQQRALDLKQQLADKPGKFDPKMSGALHYVSDSYGHPIVSLKDGSNVPYRTPGKPGTPLSAKDALTLRGSIASFADALKNGATDPKTGAQLQKAVDIQAAIGSMAARGYLQGPLAAWGLQALASSYGYTPDQVKEIASGFDPATGGQYGAPATGAYSVPVPEGWGETHGGKKDPRFATSKTWNNKADPIDHYMGSTGIIVTRSGQMVGPDGKYL